MEAMLLGRTTPEAVIRTRTEIEAMPMPWAVLRSPRNLAGGGPCDGSPESLGLLGRPGHSREESPGPWRSLVGYVLREEAIGVLTDAEIDYFGSQRLGRL